MKLRTLTLATTSLVALGLAAAPASAKGMMGDVSLGYGYNWQTFEIDSSSVDLDHPAIFGGGRVNIPYSDTVNVQLDAVGGASLDTDGFFFGKLGNQASHFAIGGHINYRDDQGLLGVFAATGRVADNFAFGFGPSVPSAAVFVGGIEGQYFCNNWTLSAQLGYMDSAESSLLANAGYARVGGTFYASKVLKLTANVAYIDGEQSFPFAPINIDATQWAWGLGAHYWFGKSVPVSAFVEYRGKDVETSLGAGESSLEQHTVNLGVTFHFGADGFQDADRNGASGELPDFDWFRLAPLPIL